MLSVSTVWESRGLNFGIWGSNQSNENLNFDGLRSGNPQLSWWLVSRALDLGSGYALNRYWVHSFGAYDLGTFRLGV